VVIEKISFRQLVWWMLWKRGYNKAQLKKMIDECDKGDLDVA